MAASFSTATYTPDRLIAQNAHLALAEPITLLSGQNLVRGALLGKVTASGKFVLSLSASGDGSQAPVAILAEDTNATGADKATVAYFRGDFDSSAITFGASHTAASVKTALRALNIELLTTQGGV
jgi:hypothetical protein